MAPTKLNPGGCWSCTDWAPHPLRNTLTSVKVIRTGFRDFTEWGVESTFLVPTGRRSGTLVQVLMRSFVYDAKIQYEIMFAWFAACVNQTTGEMYNRTLWTTGSGAEQQNGLSGEQRKISTVSTQRPPKSGWK